MSEPYYDPSERPDDDLTQEEFEEAMRPTPLTDEFFDGIGVYGIGRPTAYEFACDLERQLTEAKKIIEKLQSQLEEASFDARERDS